jgi:hypothetical protein
MAKVKNYRTKWGSWILKQDSLTLELEDNGESKYSISLEYCNSSSGILNHIFQVSNKTWSRPKVITDLLKAIDDVFFPQVSFCLDKTDNKVNPREMVDDYLVNGPNKVQKLYAVLNNKAL